MNANVAAKGDDVSVDSAVYVEVSVRDGDRAVDAGSPQIARSPKVKRSASGRYFSPAARCCAISRDSCAVSARAVRRGTLRSLILSLRQRRGAPERQGGKNE
jgi:hypothetical protein